jgi:hypothetical protein
MALIVEDGSEVSGANSYVSVNDFVTWADARGLTYPAYPDIEQKIYRAMDYIESLSFIGQKNSETQALQWPRAYVLVDGYGVDSDEIPAQLKLAVYEAVKLEIDGDSKLTPTERETEKEKIGDIEVTYASSSGMKRQTPALTRALKKLVRAVNEINRV